MKELAQIGVGDRVVLPQDAQWTNFKCPTVTLPAGTVLIIESWRPEGWMCRTETGEFFFLFHRYTQGVN